jgi:Arc/MetJ-type ribon-helix-helix transcriptional regulator
LTPTAAAESFRGDRIPNQEQDMSFPLSPEFERAVLDRVRSGQYASPEDVLAAMMEALDDAEAEYDSKLEALRREIDLGLESEKRDPLIPGEEVEAWLRARIGGGAR